MRKVEDDMAGSLIYIGIFVLIFEECFYSALSSICGSNSPFALSTSSKLWPGWLSVFTSEPLSFAGLSVSMQSLSCWQLLNINIAVQLYRSQRYQTMPHNDKDYIPTSTSSRFVFDVRTVAAVSPDPAGFWFVSAFPYLRFSFRMPRNIQLSNSTSGVG